MLDALGLQKTSLVDYPGLIAATLFTAGCNMACSYCHNQALISHARPASFLPRNAVMRFLRSRLGLIGGVCITGGEPLVHADLPGLVADIRALGLRVKVDTNGLLPERIAGLHADFIAMDLKTAPERYAELGAALDAPRRIRESVEIIRSLGVPYQFRTTMVPGLTGEEDLAAIGALLRPGDPYVRNPYRPAASLANSPRMPYTRVRVTT